VAWFVPGTRRSHDTAVNKLVLWARRKGIVGPLAPVPTRLVEAWVASLAGSINGDTIKTYLTAIRSWHIDMGHNDDDISTESVQRVIRGIKRYHGNEKPVQALPINLPILEKVINHLTRSPASVGGIDNALALPAVFTLGFTCFMRGGEMTYDNFDAHFHLSVGSYDRGQRSITIPASKADPFRTGIKVMIPSKLPADIDPLQHLDEYLAYSPPRPPTRPLFRLGGLSHFNKTTVFNNHLANCLRSIGLAATGFIGHSFRRGAATWAKSVAVPDEMIKVLGRWAGDSCRRYIDQGDDLREVRRQLFTPQSTLPPSGITRDAWIPT
jgi:hypothetical protein